MRTHILFIVLFIVPIFFLSFEQGSLAMLPDESFKTGLKNLEQAHAHFYTAADQGHANAQYVLGQMHQEGLGAPQSDGLAAYWFEKAADQGLREAQEHLEKVSEGAPARDFDQALDLYGRAQAKGLKQTQQRLTEIIAMIPSSCAVTSRPPTSMPAIVAHAPVPSPSATPISSPSTGECVICLNAEREIVFIPCGHIASCEKCSSGLVEKVCPVCRKPFEKAIKVYFP